MSVILIETKRHIDHRGFFTETYSRVKYLDYGIENEFVQDNHSLSKEVGTLRGLHFQAPPNAQAKLIRCIRGAIFDVAVDLRINSPTYGHWEGHKLTENNRAQLFIPVGFAHGFVTLEPNSEIDYKCSDYYSPDTERSIRWNDPNIGIDWPIVRDPILSSKDANAPLLKDTISPFVYGKNS